MANHPLGLKPWTLTTRQARKARLPSGAALGSALFTHSFCSPITDSWPETVVTAFATDVFGDHST